MSPSLSGVKLSQEITSHNNCVLVCVSGFDLYTFRYMQLCVVTHPHGYAHVINYVFQEHNTLPLRI